MTKILKIVMRGFKSFANKTELPFKDKFNVVLGPNGAGKSNILDALCFVLGKGSTKGLRAEKASNLIYNGGKTKNPAKEGEVSIYFDNKSKVFPTDNDVIKVTRIVKHSGQSVYRINDKTRTRQQVLDLMAIAKIDPDGYNIILQGDIEKFVEMPSIERRQIVEEIAGISIYEEKKQKAMNEMNKVQEKLNEADIILAERKIYLSELKKDRNQALKYRELEKKISQNKASLLSRNIKKKEEEIGKLEESVREQREKSKNLQEEINELKKLVNEKKKSLAALEEEVEKRGEKEQIKLHKEVEQLKVDSATNKSRISSCENEIKRISARKDQLQKTFDEINERVSGLNARLGELEKEKAKDEKELSELNRRIESFRKDHEIDAVGDVEKEIDALDRSADEKQKEVQQLREKQQELLREKDRVEFQISSIDEKITKVAAIEKEHKTDISKLKTRKDELKRLADELDKCLTEDSSLALQIENARVKLSKLQEELAKLNAQNAGIKESALMGTATQKIIENKEKFGGVYNTVAELGNANSKYSLALDIAAGPRIKSIVVENDRIAADCIKYLKKNKLGVATFLPLNKIESRPIKDEIKRFEKAEGVHGFAIDLISYDKKFANIFSYVFADTLVVDDIDTARKIGIGNARMVTLDGDLMEISGVMHGGYREKKRNISFQQNEILGSIEESEKEITQQKKLLDVIEKRRKENEEKITGLRGEKAAAEGEIIKTEKSLHLDERDLDISKNTKAELKEGIKGVERGLAEVQSKVSSLNKELAETKINKQKLRSRITDLRNPTLLAELNAFEQKKEELREGLNNIKGEIINIKAQIKDILMPEKENILKILKQHDREKSEFEDEIGRINKKIKEQEKELQEKEAAKKKFYSKFNELFNERAKLNDEIQKSENKIILKEEQIRALDEKLNSVSISEAMIKGELAGLHEEFKQYEGVELTDKAEEQIRKEIRDFEKLVEQLGSVNLKALEIYDNVEKGYENLLKKKATLESERGDVLGMINEIEGKKKELFIQTYNVVNKNFMSIFLELSTKGEASLELENPESPFDGGVRIKVRITGKKFLDIRSLSGGEKTLTALAFIFAIQEHKPAYFYILDEVDAALDKRNSEKLAKLISKYAQKAQYIMISHNDYIISEAENLYGVSMNEHGMSKVVSLKI